MIRFGPAGWSYADWNGVVYPKPKPRGFDPLTYLASYFDTIEINSTFYRPAREEIAKGWASRVGANPDFRFTVKVWRRFTHQRAEAWSRSEVKEALAGPRALRARGRLGALLLQFPWSFRDEPENRQWLEDVFGALRGFPLVVEVRHASWSEGDFLRDLTERGVGFVNIDQPQFRNSIAPSAHATSRIGYIRVHGRNYREWWRRSSSPDARYDYLYTAAELKPWVDRARELADDPRTEDVYVVTNNHYRGKAVVNALMLKSMSEGAPVEAPPELCREYPDELADFVEPEHRSTRKRGAA